MAVPAQPTGLDGGYDKRLTNAHRQPALNFRQPHCFAGSDSPCCCCRGYQFLVMPSSQLREQQAYHSPRSRSGSCLEKAYAISSSPGPPTPSSASNCLFLTSLTDIFYGLATTSCERVVKFKRMAWILRVQRSTAHGRQGFMHSGIVPLELTCYTTQMSLNTQRRT